MRLGVGSYRESRIIPENRWTSVLAYFVSFWTLPYISARLLVNGLWGTTYYIEDRGDMGLERGFSGGFPHSYISIYFM